MWTSVLQWASFWVPYRQLAGLISQSSSFSRSEQCRHLNRARLKSPPARPPSSACHYYTGVSKGRRCRFSVAVAEQRSRILRLFLSGGLTPFHTGSRQWRQMEGLREHLSHLSGLITIQCGVKALSPFACKFHTPLPPIANNHTDTCAPDGRSHCHIVSFFKLQKAILFLLTALRTLPLLREINLKQYKRLWLKAN